MTIDLENIENFQVRPATRATFAEFEQIDAENVIDQFQETYTKIQCGGRVPANWEFYIVVWGYFEEKSWSSAASIKLHD
jgi:hypothetical protein